MAYHGKWLIGALLLLSSLRTARADDDPKGIEFFEKKIRPVLTERCYSCHSVRAKKLKGALLLDSRQGMLKGGNMGAAVDPGNPAGSILVKAIRYHDTDLQMPPKEKLPDAVIKDFERWIRMGAPDPRKGDASAGPTPIRAKDLWSFRPVQDVVVPKVKDGSWVRNEIDRFILAKLEKAGLKPAPPTDKRTLIRRATFDLIGLPPTPEEVEAFLKDDAPDAFARVIERLLESPHYGERWGRHWMDVVRYADTSGDGSDTPIPEVYLYRKYIIDAFNRDMPYDQFILEQIAGDRLAFDDPGDPRFNEKIIATGYIALARRFNNSKYGDMHLVIENTIDTIGKGMLGMSLGCARCHDHKFDPITREDYYGLYGYFSSTQYPHAGTEHGRGHDNLVPLTPDPKLFEAGRKYINEWAKLYNGWRKERKKGAREKFQELQKNRPDVEFAWAVIDRKKPADAAIHLMGQPRRRGKSVPRGTIGALAETLPKIPKGRSGRLQLAKWIVSPDNPLTARVMANRVWQYHFGRGIVPTSSTFGSQGQPPTHPMLLDWLARRFVKDGWSIKNLHRLMMNSSAYRVAGEADAASLAADPPNKLFGRSFRRRLEGEAIRDAFLAVSGTLDTSPAGPHPFPAEDKINYTQHTPFTADYDHNRRSVYLMSRRLGRSPFMNLFDGPDTNVSAANRRSSTVPLQALFMMNSPFVRKASEAFAGRVIKHSDDEAERVERAYVLAFSRPATSVEKMESLEYLKQYRKGLAEAGIKGDAAKLAWASLSRILLSGSEFVYVD